MIRTMTTRTRRSPAPTAIALGLAFLLILTTAACESTTAPPLNVEFDATIQLFVLDGPDTYLLRRDNSPEAYYPLNLPSEFRVEGARVRVEGLLIREYRVLLHQPVEIRSIEFLTE